MTELDGINLNIIWIHQKCQRHIFMKVLRRCAHVSWEQRRLQMYGLQLDTSRKIKVDNLSASEKSSTSSNISWENLLAGLLSSTGAKVPSFFSTIRAFVFIWLGWWAVDFAPFKVGSIFPVWLMSLLLLLSNPAFSCCHCLLAAVSSSFSSWKFAVSNCCLVSYFLLRSTVIHFAGAPLVDFNMLSARM